ncbi:MAG TPA: hypothetical protein VFN15_05260 [Solirubrobacterales bacterium]|nr:hypothetical protein [Solirubrobacterales bacterium]
MGRTTATPNRFLVVGTSTNKSPAASVTSTYTDVSIPVQAGDILGLHSNGNNKDCGSLVAGYTATYLGSTDPAPGDFVNTAFTSGLRLDISATLEPDCDADGLGDETEDSDLSACAPAPVVAPTGQRGAAIKKCKKNFPGWAKAKKRKKCVNRAKKLPV